MIFNVEDQYTKQSLLKPLACDFCNKKIGATTTIYNNYHAISYDDSICKYYVSFRKLKSETLFNFKYLDINGNIFVLPVASDLSKLKICMHTSFDRVLSDTPDISFITNKPITLSELITAAKEKYNTYLLLK